MLVFSYLRTYNPSPWLPMTGSPAVTNAPLTCGYATLALPYPYREVDTGLRTIDVHRLTKAAPLLGAGWPAILFRVIFPNIRSAILSDAFLTFAIVIGEFTLVSLLDRPALGPYLRLVGANRAYEPHALAVIAFLVTWACMGTDPAGARAGNGGLQPVHRHHRPGQLPGRHRPVGVRFGENAIMLENFKSPLSPLPARGGRA